MYIIFILVLIFIAFTIYQAYVCLHKNLRRHGIDRYLPDEVSDDDTSYTGHLNRIFRNERLACQDFENHLISHTIYSKDHLKLQGFYLKQESDNHQWVIVVHGYTDNHYFMLPYGRHFYEKGYNVLLPDNRTHGQSEGSYISMGWFDKDDILLWADWIVSNDPQAQIILMGLSMGGATVMMAAGENHPNIIGYIEDCGYTSVFDQFAYVTKKSYHLPPFPFIYMDSLLCKMVCGYGWKQASAVDQIRKCKMPILFIHGEKDDYVPTKMVYEVYEACTSEKQLWICKNAPHARSMESDPQTYFNIIFKFIDEYITKK